MKLTKQQITALANEILNDCKKEAQEVKNTEEYINFEASLSDDVVYQNLVEIRELFNQLTEEERKAINGYYYIQDCVSAYVKSKRDKQYQVVLPTIGSIENKIILKTIEVDSLSELIQSVKESL